MKFADDFKAFLGKAKSEMAFVREAARVYAERGLLAG
jgi:propanediol dehydratase small subunit